LEPGGQTVGIDDHPNVAEMEQRETDAAAGAIGARERRAWAQHSVDLPEQPVLGF
jgi:hypothetical protein